MSELPVKAGKLPILIRPATQGDINFIFNSWLKSSHSTLPKAFEIPHTIYYSEHHKLLETILKRCTILVACDKKDPTMIYGYIVAELLHGFPTIHYLYVKQTFRRLGIATNLLNCLDINQESVIFNSHTSPSFINNFGNKRQFIYNPYLQHAYGDQSETVGVLNYGTPSKPFILETKNEIKD